MVMALDAPSVFEGSGRAARSAPPPELEVRRARERIPSSPTPAAGGTGHRFPSKDTPRLGPGGTGSPVL